MTRDDETVFEFDPERAGEISDLVIEAVASRAGEDPLDIQPLHFVMDSDALNAVFAPRLDGTPRSTDISVRFSYCGYQVVVRGSGRISVSER